MADCQFAEPLPFHNTLQGFPWFITQSFVPEFQGLALAEAPKHFLQFKRCCHLTGQCPWIKILFGTTRLLLKLNILAR